MNWFFSILLAGTMMANGVVPFRSGVFDSPIVSSANSDVTEKFSQTYPFSSDGKISVSNVNGGIRIDTWDKNEIRLEYTKIASDKERFKDIEVEIDSSTSQFSIETRFVKHQNSRWHLKGTNNMKVDYMLTVPNTARLDEIESVNGEVVVTGSKRFSSLSVVNGEIIANDLEGDAKLSSVNGPVSASFKNLSKSSKLDLETVNGSLELKIPSNSNARLSAESINGNISNSFGLAVSKGKFVGSGLNGRIGDGSAEINLSTVNGAIRVVSNDGKTVANVNNIGRKGEESPLRQGSHEPPLPPDAPGRNESRRRNRDSAETFAKGIERLAQLGEKMAVAAENEALKNKDATFSKGRFFRGAPFIMAQDGKLNVKSDSTLVVDAEVGSMFVRGSDGKEVTYSLIERGIQGNSSEVEVAEKNGVARINVDAIESGAISLEISVPRHINIKVKTPGDVRLEGVTGKIDLDSVSGDINIRNSSGQLAIRAETDDHPQTFRIIGFEGRLEGDLDEATAYLEGKFENIKLTGNGSSVYLTIAPEIAAQIHSEDFNLDSLGRIAAEGIGFTRTGEIITFGAGAANFNFALDGGELILRSQKSIKSKIK